MASRHFAFTWERRKINSELMQFRKFELVTVFEPEPTTASANIVRIARGNMCIVLFNKIHFYLIFATQMV